MPEQPTYESINLSRHRGRGLIVDRAPQHAKISVTALFDRAPWVALYLLEPDMLNVADQVLYRITGWDPTDATLTIELVEDWRPKKSEAAGAES